MGGAVGRLVLSRDFGVQLVDNSVDDFLVMGG